MFPAYFRKRQRYASILGWFGLWFCVVRCSSLCIVLAVAGRTTEAPVLFLLQASFLLVLFLLFAAGPHCFTCSVGHPLVDLMMSKTQDHDFASEPPAEHSAPCECAVRRAQTSKPRELRPCFLWKNSYNYAEVKFRSPQKLPFPCKLVFSLSASGCLALQRAFEPKDTFKGDRRF